MTTFSLKHLTRDSFIVEFEGNEYTVDGERYGDGTWEIFPKMVYRPGPDGKLELLEDESLKTKVVTALREHWHEYRMPPTSCFTVQLALATLLEVATSAPYAQLSVSLAFRWHWAAQWRVL